MEEETGAPPTFSRRWMKRLKEGVPWSHLAVVFSVVTLGVSGFIYRLVSGNTSQFPPHGLFYAWVFFWFQVLPIAVAFGIDVLIRRRLGEGRTFRAWRSGLYALVLCSFLRQVQLVTMDASQLEAMQRVLLGWGSVMLVLLPLAIVAAMWGLAFWVCRGMTLWFRYLGVLALVLTFMFFIQSGLWGPAWRSDGEAAPRSGTGPPVFIFVFDELGYVPLAPGGEIDRESFPNLADLADQGVSLTNATTNHVVTEQSLPILFTGRMEPGAEQATFFKAAAGEYDTVVIESWLGVETWLRSSGHVGGPTRYRGRAHILSRGPLAAGTSVASTFLEFLLPRRLRNPVMHLLGLAPYFHGLVSREVDSLSAEIEADPRGTIVFWHSSLPHYPYALTAEGSLHGSPADAVWAVGQDPENGRRNYLEQVRLVDRLMGEFIGRLKRAGLYEEAIIIVTGDHGPHTWVPFEPAEYPDVRNDLAPSVPLIIRAPGLEGVDPGLDYQHIDLAPTLLDLLGIPYDPGDFDGVPVGAKDRPSRDKVFHGHGRKYVRDADTGLWVSTGK